MFSFEGKRKLGEQKITALYLVDSDQGKVLILINNGIVDNISSEVAYAPFNRRAAAVPNSIQRLWIHYNTFNSFRNRFFIFVLGFWQIRLI